MSLQLPIFRFQPSFIFGMSDTGQLVYQGGLLRMVSCSAPASLCGVCRLAVIDRGLSFREYEARAMNVAPKETLHVFWLGVSRLSVDLGVGPDRARISSLRPMRWLYQALLTVQLDTLVQELNLRPTHSAARFIEYGRFSFMRVPPVLRSIFNTQRELSALFYCD